MDDVSKELLARSDMFWSRVEKRDENACWPWKGSINSDGYGQLEVRINGKRRVFYTHRVVYLLSKGTVPNARVSHSCESRTCCNPKHIQIAMMPCKSFGCVEMVAVWSKTGLCDHHSTVKPCKSCGGQKGPGKAKKYCDECANSRSNGMFHDIPEELNCTHCRRILPINEFPMHAGVQSRFNRDSWCKSCTKERKKKHRSTQEFRKKENERLRTERQDIKHGDQAKYQELLKKEREYGRKWERDNIASVRANQRRRKQIARTFVDEIKLASGCVDCGYREFAAALEFDHRDPATKEFNVGLMTGSRRDKLLKEIAKCDVRCANCHRIKTVKKPPDYHLNPNLIGVAGLARSGKDTVVGFLTAFGYKRMAFADPLKEMAVKLGWDGSKDHSGNCECCGMANGRTLLQVLGTECIREIIGHDAWINIFRKRLNLSEKVAVSDVRFPSEADAIKRLGGVVWLVTRPGVTTLDHSSETSVQDITPTVVISNDGTIDQLRVKIATLANEILSHPRDHRKRRVSSTH